MIANSYNLVTIYKKNKKFKKYIEKTIKLC